MFTFSISKVCHAFDNAGIGTRVLDKRVFLTALEEALETAEFSEKETALVDVAGAINTVSAGVGKRTANPDDYVVREHRGQVSAYLKREHAAPVESLNVVVYSYTAYVSDPDVDSVELDRIKSEEPTHVIVAVLAGAGPQSPVTPHRFCHNVAGGNIEYADYSKEKLVELAKESLAYHNEWCVVAD